MAYISRERKTQDAGNEPGPDLLRQEVRRGRGKQVRAVRRVGRAPHVAVRGQPRRPERPARPLDAAPSSHLGERDLVRRHDGVHHAQLRGRRRLRHGPRPRVDVDAVDEDLRGRVEAPLVVELARRRHGPDLRRVRHVLGLVVARQDAAGRAGREAHALVGLGPPPPLDSGGSSADRGFSGDRRFGGDGAARSGDLSGDWGPGVETWCSVDAAPTYSSSVRPSETPEKPSADAPRRLPPFPRRPPIVLGFAAVRGLPRSRTCSALLRRCLSRHRGSAAPRVRARQHAHPAVVVGALGDVPFVEPALKLHDGASRDWPMWRQNSGRMVLSSRRTKKIKKKERSLRDSNPRPKYRALNWRLIPLVGTRVTRPA